MDIVFKIKRLPKKVVTILIFELRILNISYSFKGSTTRLSSQKNLGKLPFTAKQPHKTDKKVNNIKHFDGGGGGFRLVTYEDH